MTPSWIDKQASTQALRITQYPELKAFMRLAIISNPNSIHTQRWVRFFAARGHDVILLGPNPLTTSLPAGIRFHDLTRLTNRRKFRFVVWTWTLRRLLGELRPDVLHAHQVTNAGWLGTGSGYHPFLVTSWGSDLLVGAQRSALSRRIAQAVLHRADYVTCVSEPLAAVARTLGTPASKVEVVHWGVDTEIFNPSGAHWGLDTAPAEPTQPTASAPRPPLVLSIRALRPIYNPLVIAQAIPRVLAARPDARFAIRTYSVDAALLAEFQRMVADAHAEHAVQYIGDLPNDAAIAELYRQAAVVVSVPSSDGTPQSVLEALACGAVPVLSDLPSLHAWVKPEVSGLYAPVADAEATAAAILRLLNDDALRGQMQAAGAQVIQKRADSRLWMQRYEQIYAQLAAGDRPQPPAGRTS